MNQFLDALFMPYEYECNGEIKQLKNDDHTEHEHGNYFVVRCEKCCNVPVYHLLTRAKPQ